MIPEHLKTAIEHDVNSLCGDAWHIIAGYLSANLEMVSKGMITLEEAGKACESASEAKIYMNECMDKRRRELFPALYAKKEKENVA